jgi:NAD(P)-dependent dehydrogenase (short-subunit alcohol dehydrogenase family)
MALPCTYEARELVTMSSIAIVSGAASGIGRAIANRLAQDYEVVLIDINPTTLPVVEKEIVGAGGNAYSILGDVSKRETHHLARILAEEKGKLIAWVNCAGWTRGAPLHDFPNDPAVFEELIGANQIGTFWGCAEAVNSFTTNKIPGAIVNISSIHGRRAWPDHAVYEMTKSAIDALTRNVAVSYGPYGIRANAVAPGAIMTPALKQSFIDAPDPKARRDSLELLTPLKRIGEPGEIAEVVSFLLSPRASYLSGQSIAVEGGWSSAMGVAEIDPELAERYGLDSKTGLPKN